LAALGAGTGIGSVKVMGVVVPGGVILRARARSSAPAFSAARRRQLSNNRSRRTIEASVRRYLVACTYRDLLPVNTSCIVRRSGTVAQQHMNKIGSSAHSAIFSVQGHSPTGVPGSLSRQL